MKRVAEVLGVSRSNLAERARGKGQPRGPYVKATDEALLPFIRRIVAARPTWLSPHYGAGEPGAGKAEPAARQS